MKAALYAPAAVLVLASPVLANDTTAAVGAGGLEIRKTDAIDMVSEDLLVSAEQIRVRYAFRNRTPEDVETVVAFPMPDRNLSDEYGGDVAYPSGFATFVEGKEVKTRLERKALVKGRDHAKLLQSLGIPLAPGAIREAIFVMDRLPAVQKTRLQQLGLAGEEEYDDDGTGMKRHLIPLWTVKDTYWWTQRFPAGRNLRVEHTYVPGIGGAVETPLAFREHRGSPDGRWAIARYCVDKAFLAALDAQAKSGNEGPGLPDKRIDYILTTGANWARPIGDFRLVIDKGRPENLVSFCADGVRKISPTRFEVRKRNWRPTRDLHVLIVEPRSR